MFILFILLIRNLSKQIDTEKRDRREDCHRRDVSDDADERDRRWDRCRCVNSTERKRSKDVTKNAGVTKEGFVTVVD